MSIDLKWDSFVSSESSNAPSTNSSSPQPSSVMVVPEGGSRFTFVENDGPGTSGSRSSTADGRNIVRSRAMQSVWDQRNKRQRDRLRDNVEIVVETPATYDRREAAKADAQRRRTSTLVRPNDVAPVRRPKSAEENPRPPQVKHESPDNSDEEDSDTDSDSDESIQDPTPRQPDEPPLVQPPEEQFEVQVQRDPAVQRQIEEAAMAALIRRQPPEYDPQAEHLDVSMLDPFQRACIHINSRTNGYLHHYFQAMSWKFTMPKQKWLRYAMEDPGLLHSVLFIASAHYSVAKTTVPGLSIDARRHAAATISIIKRRMMDPVQRCSDATIGAIGRVITWSIINGEEETFRVNMKHMARLIQMRDGIDHLGLDGQLKYLVCCNTFGGATIWFSDIPETLRYPYGPLLYSPLNDVPEIEHPEYAASSFEALHADGQISQDIVEVCLAMAKLDVPLSEPNAFHGNENAQAEFGHCSNKLALRLSYGTHRECSAYNAARQMPDRGLCIREVTRLTVLCYLFAFHRDVPFFCLPMKKSIQRIRFWLEKGDNHLGLKLEDAWGGGRLGGLLLWTLIITGTLTPNVDEKQEIGRQMRVVAETMNVNGWSKVQQVCRTFLWQEPLCDKKCLLFWNDTLYFQPIGLMDQLSLNSQKPRLERTATAPAHLTFVSSNPQAEGSHGGRTRAGDAQPSHASRSRDAIVMRDGDTPSPQLTAPSLSTDNGSDRSSTHYSSSASPPAPMLEFAEIQKPPQKIRFREPYTTDNKLLQSNRRHDYNCRTNPSPNRPGFPMRNASSRQEQYLNSRPS